MFRFLASITISLLLFLLYAFAGIEVAILFAIFLLAVASFYMTRGKVPAVPIYDSSVRLGQGYSLLIIISLIALVWVIANIGPQVAMVYMAIATIF